VQALETPDGAITTFRSPVPWTAGTVTPTINGRMRTTNFTVIDAITIQFADAPRYDDVVGFFLTPTTS
jgi:hypothetical protein